MLPCYSEYIYVACGGCIVRVCVIRSVDGTSVTAYTVHECEGSTRMGARPRRYIFTGHSNGSIQVQQFLPKFQ